MRSRTPALLPWYWARPTIWVRRILLWVAEKEGVTDHWLRRDGRVRVLTLVLPVVLVVAGVASVWQAALGYGGLLVFLWALFQAHQRVVIESFDNYTTPPGQPTDSTGRDGHHDN